MHRLRGKLLPLVYLNEVLCLPDLKEKDDIIASGTEKDAAWLMEMLDDRYRQGWQTLLVQLAAHEDGGSTRGAGSGGSGGLFIFTGLQLAAP